MTANNSRPVVEFRPHSGQDPQTLGMYADVYGWEVKWPEKVPPVEHGDPLRAFFYCVGALLWFGPAVSRVFPSFKKPWFLCVVVAAMLLQTVAHAAYSATDHTAPGVHAVDSGHSSVELKYSSGQVYFEWAYGGPEGGNNQGAFAKLTTGNGGPGLATIFDESGVTGDSGTTTPVTMANHDWVVIFARHIDAAGDVHDDYAYVEIDIPATFAVDFVIPSNGTEGQIHYQFLQDGEVIQTYDSSPGDPQSTLHITGLPNNHEVTMQAILTVQEIGEDPLNPGQYIITGSSVVGTTSVSHGTPLTGGTPGQGSAPLPVPPSPTPMIPSAPPPAPTPATPVAPTTPTAPVSPRTPPPVPFNNTSTGGTTDPNAAKTQDVAIAANAVVAAEGETTAAVTEGANGIIDAVNTAATATTEGSNGVIDAVNKAAVSNTAAAAAVVKAVDGLKAALSEANSSTGGTAAPAGATNPSTQTAVWNPGTLNTATMVSGKLPTAPTISTTVSAVHSFTIAFDIPVPGGSPISVNRTIDFAEAPYATPIAIFRGICLVFLTLTFFLLTFWTVRGAFTTTK